MPCYLCVSGSKDERVLPECHHAVCEDCLTAYIITSVESKRSKNKVILKCPQCKMEFQGPDSKKSVSEWIRKLPVVSCKQSGEIETNDVPTENVSEQHDITSTEVINATLGPQSYTFVVEDQVSGKTSSRREKIDRTYECYKHCSTHHGRNVEFYCCSHDEFICRMCIIREQNHRHCDNIIDLDDAGDIICKHEIHMTVLSDLETVKEYNEKLINEIDEARKTSETQRLEIEKTFETVRQNAAYFIDKREKACLKTFDEAMDNQSTQLNKTKAEIKANLEQIESIAIQLKEIIGSDVKRSYLFPTVLKIIRNIYQRKANTHENQFQSTVAKLKIHNEETEILEQSYSGTQISFEKQQVTLSSFPLVQTTSERLLQAVSVESYVQTASKGIHGTVTGAHDQKDSVTKPPLRLHQAESEICKNDADKKNTLDQMQADAKHTSKDLEQDILKRNESRKGNTENERESAACVAKELAGKGYNGKYTTPQMVSNTTLEHLFASNCHHTQTMADTEIKPPETNNVVRMFEEKIPTRILDQDTQHNKSMNTPVLRHTFSETLVLPHTLQGWLSDVLVLKNGNVVFSETLHSRLVITNEHFLVISTLGMKYAPGHMALNENGSILICQKGTNIIAVFGIDENVELKLKSCVTLPWHPKSINTLPDGDALVSMQAQSYAWKIVKLQRHDNDTFKRFKAIGRQIDDGYSLLVAVSQTGSPLIIQCCNSEGVVHGFELDGNDKFSYKCDQPEAATYDRYGYIYIVEYSGVVHVLRQDGTAVGVNHISNMHKCNRIAYDERNDHLIVTTYKGSKIHVLQIDYISI